MCICINLLVMGEVHGLFVNNCGNFKEFRISGNIQMKYRSYAAGHLDSKGCNQRYLRKSYTKYIIYQFKWLM